MNARLSAVELGRLEPPRLRPWRSRSPEAVELMRRVLLLTVPEVAARTLTGGGPETWASAVYYALARRELEARDRRRRSNQLARTAEAPELSLDGALEAVRSALRSRAPGKVVDALLGLLDGAHLDDPVVLRRVLAEVDVWAFAALRGR